MEIIITKARMEHSKEQGYVGHVEFKVANHRVPYEITLYNKNDQEWMYGLHFLHESGPEPEILALEEFIDEDDTCFDRLVQAAKDSYAQP